MIENALYSMAFYRRHLPHWIPDHTIIFVTWRLAGSVPRSSVGPRWLGDPQVASILQDALRYGETARSFYCLFAWVIMPNHVHAIFEPQLELSAIMRWLKGRTARRANRILQRPGLPFWQEESFDHWIRNSTELQGLIDYVESNPVKAGLVDAKEHWPWSSAATQ